MKKTAVLFSLLSLFLFTSLASAEKIANVRILEYGIFKSDNVRSQPVSSLAKGTNYIVRNATLVKKTNVIPAVLGTEFGIRFMINGSPAGKKVLVIHKKLLPGMKHPQKGVIQKEEVSSLQAIGMESYWGYTFHSDWELAPGPWTFQVFIGGKKMAEQTFQVVVPEK